MKTYLRAITLALAAACLPCAAHALAVGDPLPLIGQHADDEAVVSTNGYIVSMSSTFFKKLIVVDLDTERVVQMAAVKCKTVAFADFYKMSSSIASLQQDIGARARGQKINGDWYICILEDDKTLVQKGGGDGQVGYVNWLDKPVSVIMKAGSRGKTELGTTGMFKVVMDGKLMMLTLGDNPLKLKYPR